VKLLVLKLHVIECAKDRGVNPLREIEKVIATSPVLANIADTSDFTYL